MSGRAPIRYSRGRGGWHDTYSAAQNDPGVRPPAEPITDEQFARLRALLAANTTSEETTR